MPVRWQLQQQVVTHQELIGPEVLPEIKSLRPVPENGRSHWQTLFSYSKLFCLFTWVPFSSACRTEWVANEYLLHGPGWWWILSVVTMPQFIMLFIRSSVLLWCDSPRVQTITMTIYIRFLAYWFAVVFCLLILGNILKNEYSNPNSNSNSNSTGSDVCCTETAMAEATLNTCLVCTKMVNNLLRLLLQLVLEWFLLHRDIVGRTNHKYTQMPVSRQPTASTSSVLAAGDSRQVWFL